MKLWSAQYTAPDGSRNMMLIWADDEAIANHVRNLKLEEVGLVRDAGMLPGPLNDFFCNVAYNTGARSH
jgi:hypothetical protein